MHQVIETGKKSKIMRCNSPSCKSEFQDKLYNKKRVFNKTAKGWRCTVCGMERGDF